MSPLMERPTVAILWFRRDLRVADNQALTAALAAADQVVPLFVRDPAILDGGRVGPLRRERLEAALAALEAELRARGGRLVVRTGRPQDVLGAVAWESGAREVHAQRDYTPYARQRDEAVAAALGPAVPLRLHAGTLLVEPEMIGERRVFTPFHRAWSRALVLAPMPAPPGQVLVPVGLLSEPVNIVGVAARGEADALARLRAFAPRAARYGIDRDRLDLAGTSALSPDLHLGTVSPRQVLELVSEEAFARQLAWRDFAAHRAWWDPASVREKRGTADRDSGGPEGPISWDQDSGLLAAWTEGRTGYPVVDAAMRQLAQTGWISNRARMIAASFLVKDLLLDWRLGRDWFERVLVDGDVASNWYNWRWVAGMGPDAAPWFRIMNPVLQGERFDPRGEWARRWVPELGRVPDAFVHRPWDAPGGVPGEYPPRIVDHAERRLEALRRFRAQREGREGDGRRHGSRRR
ncbi:MAG: cryptochrome/photolyase family protein [Candidatus Limnocylindrales bacterium]